MRARLFTGLAVLAAAAAASAQTFVTSPIAHDDAIQWSQFGDGVSVPAGTSGQTDKGYPFTVDTDTTVISGKLFNENLPSGSTFDPVSIDLTFATSIAGFATTVNPDWSNFPFTVTLEAFGYLGASLGSTTISNTGTGPVYLGFTDPNAVITGVRYTVATGQPRVTSNFSLSPADVRTQAVPEPASLLALAAGFVLVRRRARSA